MNAVVVLGWDEVVVGGGGLSIVVAKQRFCGMSDCLESKIAVEMRRRVWGRRAAILSVREGRRMDRSGVVKSFSRLVE